MVVVFGSNLFFLWFLTRDSSVGLVGLGRVPPHTIS